MDFACNCGKPRPSATSSQPPRPQPYIPSIALASLFASHCLESRSACLHRLVKLLMCQGTRLDSTIWVTSVEWKKYTGCGFLKRFNITATLCRHPMLIVIWWRPEGRTNGGSRQGRLWRVNGSYRGEFNDCTEARGRSERGSRPGEHRLGEDVGARRPVEPRRQPQILKNSLRRYIQKRMSQSTRRTATPWRKGA